MERNKSAFVYFGIVIVIGAIYLSVTHAPSLVQRKNLSGIIAKPGSTGQSLAFTTSPAVRGSGILPNIAAFQNLNNWRVEGAVENFVSQNTTVGIFELDSSLQIRITSNNTLQLIGLNSESISLPLNGATDFRFAAQRNTATGQYTLEMWDVVSGNYQMVEGSSTLNTSVNRANYRYSIGSFYEPNAPNFDIDFLRWSSAVQPLATVPQTGTPGISADLLDLEFEGNLNDSSPSQANFTLSQGTANYIANVVPPPTVNLGSLPTTISTNAATSLNVNSSFGDAPLTYSWSQVSGPGTGVFSSPNQSVTNFTAPVFGTYDLNITVTDALGQSNSQNFEIGAVPADSNGVVQVNNPQISELLGPMIRFGANPWAWADNRELALANNQLSLLNSVWADWWDTPDTNGTISVTNGGTSVTGSGTQFLSDLGCSPGGTPTNPYLVIWYPSAAYPGTFGRAFDLVKTCLSNTQLTLNVPFEQSASQTGLSYTVGSNAQVDAWIYSPIPGNYYDNVLAYYDLYYRTGLTKYRDAARILAQRFWTGPNMDRGENYDTANLGGSFVIAGPARGQSVTGLILWSLDTGQNIWPGMHDVWGWWRDVGWQYGKNLNWKVQVGDIREQGYITAGYALCSIYDTDPTWRSNCAGYLKDYIDDFWGPLEINDHWTNTNFGNAFYAAADGSTYVTVTNGSPNITLTGGTWNTGIFDNANYPGSNLHASVWFTNDPTNTNVAGNKNSDDGDAGIYYVANVIDGTHAVLSTPYTGTSGKKGMAVSAISGFGTQPFMLGLVAGVFSSYAHDAMVTAGDTTEAAKVKQFAVDALSWLTTTGFDQNNQSLYGARGFINCEPSPDNDPSCASGAVIDGEAMRAFTATYALTGDPAIKTAGDAIYSRLWCKPGYACGGTYDGSYLSDVDDPPTGYMITNQSQSNKWFGFFFGYGFGSGWPAVSGGSSNGNPPPPPPVVSVNSPISGTTLSGNASPVSIAAQSNIGIQRVELYVDQTLVGTDTSAPYNFSINTTSFTNGSHSLTARAYDESGVSANSNAVAININNTLQTLGVSLVASPASGIAPLPISLKATISAGGSAQGTINYIFYCNRPDTGTNVTTPADLTVSNTTATTYTTQNTCSYQVAGTYTAKVIAEQGSASPAQAQATVVVMPLIQSTSSNGSSGGGGSGGGNNGNGTNGSGFAITSVIVSQITNTSALVTIYANKPASFQILYGPTVQYKNKTIPSANLETDYVNLAGLTANTLYDLEIIATPLGSNTPIYSSNYIFTTLPLTLKPASSTITGSVAVITPTFTFTRYLIYGKTGNDVLMLQTALRNLGYLPKTFSPTTFFGSITQHALLLFQSDHQLNRSGYLDVQSEALFNKIILNNPTLLGNSAVATTTAVTTTTITSGSTKIFASGARVKVTASILRIHGNPTTQDITGGQVAGSLGTIIGGPVVADGYTFWQIKYDKGVSGWSVQSYLQLQ